MTTPTNKTGFVANEPVIAASIATWLVSVVGTIVLGHTDLITSDQWGSLATILVPLIAGVILTGVAWVTRKVVTPAWKAVSAQTVKVGVSPELLTQLEAKVDEVVGESVQRELSKLHKPVEDKPLPS